MGDDNLFDEIRRIVSNGEAASKSQGYINRMLLAAVADLRDDTCRLPEMEARLERLEHASVMMFLARMLEKYPKFTIVALVVAVGSFLINLVDVLGRTAIELSDVIKAALALF